MLQRGRQKLFSFSFRFTRWEKVLGLLVISYTILFFGLGKRCYDVFGYDSGGTAVFNNMMWWTCHGKPFFIAALTTDAATEPTSNLAIHAAYFWVFLVPIYWMVPSVYTLFFLQSLALGLAAVPMYLIARKALADDLVGVILAAAYILLPPIVSQNLNQIGEPSFLPVVLLFAFYFFIEKKFRLFVLWSILACLNRENVPLTVIMFGIWALIERRHWKWVVTPIVWGMMYFWFVTDVAMPYFRDGQPWHVTRQFSSLGSDIGEILKNIILHPGLLIERVFERERLQYFFFLTQPMAWVFPFTSPASLIALPDYAINVLSDNNALRVIGWHYNLTTSTSLFVGSVLGLRKIDNWLNRILGSGTRHIILIAIGLLALSVAHWFLWFQPHILKRMPYHDALVRGIAVVPENASVLSSFRIQAHFSSRPRYDALSVFQSHPEYASSFEYVLLDANERRYPPFVTQEFFDSFNKNPQYELVFAEKNVFVFRKSDYINTRNSK